MAVRAIPRKLLCHSVIHRWGKTTDSWGSESWENSRGLSRVRVETTTKLVQTKDNTQVQLALLVIYDSRNSTPAGEAFELDECITWLGQDYTIVSIDRLYDFNRLHHIELGLV